MNDLLTIVVAMKPFLNQIYTEVITMFKRFAMTGMMVAVMAVTAGCAAVGPDFHEPAAQMPAAFRHSGSVAGSLATDAAHLPQHWWEIFRDPSLNRLEETALSDNYNVKAAAARLLQAEAQLGSARANRAPQLTANAGVSNSRTSANTSQALMMGGRAISGNQYQTGLGLSYELDLWGKLHRAVEAADAQALAASYDRDGVLLLLSSQVATTYWQWRGLQAEQRILQDALASRKETQQLVQARFDNGFTNELDVARAQVETANAEADLHEAQRQSNLLEHALAVLIGASPSEGLKLTADVALPEAPRVQAGLPASLLAQRPDLQQSVALLRSSNAQIGVAEAAFYPSLQLTGNFGFASESLSKLMESGSRQFSVGPLALSLPVFDGGRNQSNLDLARARYDEALANHEGKLLTALREVEDALSDTEQRQQQAQAQQQAQTAAGRAYTVARFRYERGLSNFLEVTDAQRSSLAADRATVQIQTQRLLAAAAVARALGGGWQPDARS
ncbi:efflux transporter outer membrane subunit [Undibacterium terreum]|uniref:Outer membrane protein, multidrug efflux system n=1 Tax=Undibacterium terreum TaxID=1224302 RepID=A0A916U1X3_9BURK|nr:efflux transporter outer membrane subunit [Undibacterium terreum]GGC57625.1 hypothetical protein GCM10011396_00580 [Undibacterium terreum]